MAKRKTKKELEKELNELKEREKQLRKTERQYRALMAISPVPVFLTNLEGKITDLSPKGQELWNLEKEEDVIGQGAFDFIAEEDLEKANTLIKKVTERGSVGEVEISFKREGGGIFIGEMNTALVKDDEGNPKGLVNTVQDITEQKHLEQEMRKQMMRFKIDGGNLYLIEEAAPSFALEVFEDLLEVDANGIVISRQTKKEFQGGLEGDYDFYWLAEKAAPGTIGPDLDPIAEKMSEVPRRSAILIERLDYLITKNGFDETLSFVQTLREIAYFYNHVIILSVDPSVLTDREAALLNKETRDVIPFQKAWVPNDLFEILKFVYSDNKMGRRPSHTAVSKAIGISKPTAGKRIRQLVNSGFLMERLKGKSKILELTPDGKRLFLE